MIHVELCIKVESRRGSSNLLNRPYLESLVATSFEAVSLFGLDFVFLCCNAQLFILTISSM